MPKINKDMLKEFVKEGFFDNPKTTSQVIEKFDSRGFTINGKKVGLVGQLLTLLCQDGLLERGKNEEGAWRFKKR